MPIYNIAGISTEIDFKHNFGLSRGQAYLSSNQTVEPQIKIEIDREKEKKLLDRFGQECFEEYEYALAGNSFYSKLLDFDGMMLHASCVVVGDKAFCFSAPSGTGKSTHTQLYLELFKNDAYILNDDKPAIRLIDGKPFAFGTPFSGKYDLSVNKGVEVCGVCFLKRDENNSIRPIGVKEVIPKFLEQTVRSTEYSHMDKLLGFLDRLLLCTDVYELSCNMDISAAELSYKVMKDGVGQK